MNTKHILIGLITAGLSSCSTAYKIEQTPDDVYYSPAPPRNEYVQVNKDEDRNVYNNTLPEDREIYRNVHSRRWRRQHDYDYGYPYDYGYYPYGNNYPVYVDPKTGTSPSTYKGARKYNLGTYGKPPVTTYTLDPKTGKIINAPIGTTTTSNGTPVRTFNRPQGTAVGNLMRKVFSNTGTNTSSNNNTTNNTNQTRSFEQSRNTNNSSSSSGSSTRSSGSSGGSAPVRTFNK